eukprot:TRINITY_DN120231_c0_g1_i1.p1 TRINITY_DN120231_c0_g1~~TRINITY_DN120231_c0_g1_i1.p1  ORF type:complete len:317 (+),score=32.86 TRINITY_DN120231_c0_g1_i1:120-953(+)
MEKNLAISYPFKSKVLELPYQLPELGLTVDLMKPAELDSTMDLLVKVFLEGEPMVRAIQATYEEFSSLAHEVQKAAIEPILTTVIRKTDTKEIVAASLHDYVSLEKLHGGKLPEKFDPVMAIVEKMEDFYRNYYKEQKFEGKIMRCFMIAVDEKFRGKNLSRHLVYAGAIVGAKHGFKRYIAECTNIFSTNVFMSVGVKPIYSVKYDEFMYKGEKPFENTNKVHTEHVNKCIGKKKYESVAEKFTLVDGPVEGILESMSGQLLNSNKRIDCEYDRVY